jgi:hypothetical protein
VFCHGFILFSCENFTPNKKGAKVRKFLTNAPCILRFNDALPCMGDKAYSIGAMIKHLMASCQTGNKKPPLSAVWTIISTTYKANQNLSQLLRLSI